VFQPPAIPPAICTHSDALTRPFAHTVALVERDHATPDASPVWASALITDEGAWMRKISLCAEDVQPPERSIAPILLTPEQAAEMLGIGRWKLYDLLRRRELPSVRIGSCRRIPASAIDQFVADLQRRQVTWVS
jgi:excisionase family DNA binding protein